MKEEALSVEEDAKNSSLKETGEVNYPYMFGYVAQSIKSSLIRINSIIELVQSL